MAILIYFNSDRAKPWQKLLSDKLSVPVYIYPDVPDPEAISFALLWQHTPEITAQFPNIQAAMSVGAGVEHLLNDPNLKAVPCARVIDANLNEQMAEYVVAAITQHRRNWAKFEQLKQDQHWLREMPSDNRKMVVSILGLGAIGHTVARALLPLGYQVQGWSQSEKAMPGVKTFSGEQGLKAILSQTNYLVCLLPVTEKTRDLLNTSLFAQLPKGAYVINIARGQLLVEDDLIAALNSGHLSGACLDVFKQEPLPKVHPFWSHPLICVTPHCAGVSLPEYVAEQAVENYQRMVAGKPLLNAVDRARGY